MKRNTKNKICSVVLAFFVIICASSFSNISLADEEEAVSTVEFNSLSGGIAYIIDSFANFLNNLIQARYQND